MVSVEIDISLTYHLGHYLPHHPPFVRTFQGGPSTWDDDDDDDGLSSQGKLIGILGNIDNTKCNTIEIYSHRDLLILILIGAICSLQ